MKIYQLTFSNGHKDWIAANTNIHAIKVWAYSGFDTDFSDFNDEDEITELTESEWETHTVIMKEEGETLTFSEWMKENSSAQVICSTRNY